MDRPDVKDAAGALAAKVCRLYAGALHGYLMQRLNDAELAQDVAQHCYLRMLKVENADLVGAPKAYLFRVAANLIWDYRQQQRRDPVVFNSELAELHAEHLFDDRRPAVDERVHQWRLLEELLLTLPPKYRQIFVLSRRDGLSGSEIATAMNLQRNTVKKYLFRAIRLLRQLARNHPDLSPLVHPPGELDEEEELNDLETFNAACGAQPLDDIQYANRIQNYALPGSVRDDGLKEGRRHGRS